MDKRTLESLLRSRGIEPASKNFEARILATARATPQRAARGAWLNQQFWMLPSPSFALAASLLIGLLIGFSSHLPSAPQSALQIYLDDEGDVL